MRSQIFNTFSDLSKDFHEDFKSLWTIPKEKRLEIIKYIPEIIKAPTNLKTIEIRNKAVKELRIDAKSALKTFDILEFIYKSWRPSYDTIEDVIHDLVDLELIPSTNIEDATSFFREFLETVRKDNTRRLEKKYAQALLPNFIGVSWHIDFRAVFEKGFMESESLEIENYEPKCIGFVPVLLMKIKRSPGEPATFEFQSGEEDLQLLIDGLNAALKDLKEAKSILTKENKR